MFFFSILEGRVGEGGWCGEVWCGGYRWEIKMRLVSLCLRPKRINCRTYSSLDVVGSQHRGAGAGNSSHFWSQTWSNRNELMGGAPSSVSPNTRRCFSSYQQPPRLAYEWIVDGKVIPSSNMEDIAVSSDNEVIVFLHGLLGNAKVRVDGYCY